MVQKAYEFRLYPTDEQKVQIAKTIGSARYVYNGFLARRKELYATEKLSLTYNQCSAILTTMKQDDKTGWLKEVDNFGGCSFPYPGFIFPGLDGSSDVSSL